MSHIEYIVWESLKKLIQYIEIEEFKGYDPYDAMNSKFFNCISFKNKLIRIGLTQTLKRSPINLRPLFGIKKDINPKGMGLLMAGYVKLINMTQKKEYTEKIKTITDILEKLKSEGYSGYCWGYNFPWQNRERFLPI
ncbi:MAG: delta-aminolevulinic acid dehydratase, partial [Candidatus Hodarchaeota archaeon]